MSRILFAWELGDGLGHVTAMRPFVLELIGRGHQVVLAVRDVRKARQVFDRVTPAIVACPFQFWRISSAFTPIVSYAHLLHSIGFNDPRNLAALIQAWTDLVNLVSPDLIVADHSPTALLATTESGISVVQLGTGFYSPPLTTPLPQIRPGPPAPEARLQADEEGVLAIVNEALERLSRKPLSTLSGVYSGVELQLLATYAELDHFRNRETARYWGVQKSFPADAPVWPRTNGPAVYAYLKMMPGLADIIQSLAQTGYPTIVYGQWVDKQARAQLETESLKLVNRPVDLGAVSERCSVAILNGTHGATAHFLGAGVPVVQIPLYVEQAMVAYRTVELGAGIMHVPSEHAAVVQSMRNVLDTPSFAESAGRFAAAYSGRDDSELVAEMVDLMTGLNG